MPSRRAPSIPMQVRRPGPEPGLRPRGDGHGRHRRRDHEDGVGQGGGGGGGEGRADRPGGVLWGGSYEGQAGNLRIVLSC